MACGLEILEKYLLRKPEDGHRETTLMLVYLLKLLILKRFHNQYCIKKFQ
jgi:hypothetical protein